MKRGRNWRSGGAAPAARVVLADDSPLIRTRLAAMLADMPGVEVVGEAADAVQAVALVQELRPDVLVLDLSMPGGGGAAVLRELRSDDAAPVIAVLTNHPYPAYRTQCLTLGAQFFFDKSSEFEKVIELLETRSWKRPSNPDVCSYRNQLPASRKEPAPAGLGNIQRASSVIDSDSGDLHDR